MLNLAEVPIDSRFRLLSNEFFFSILRCFSIRRFPVNSLAYFRLTIPHFFYPLRNASLLSTRYPSIECSLLEKLFQLVRSLLFMSSAIWELLKVTFSICAPAPAQVAELTSNNYIIYTYYSCLKIEKSINHISQKNPIKSTRKSIMLPTKLKNPSHERASSPSFITKT